MTRHHLKSSQSLSGTSTHPTMVTHRSQSCDYLIMPWSHLISRRGNGPWRWHNFARVVVQILKISIKWDQVMAWCLTGNKPLTQCWFIISWTLKTNFSESQRNVQKLKETHSKMFSAKWHSMFQTALCWFKHWHNGPLARYIKLCAAHVPGMFSPPPLVNDPVMYHCMCVTHVPWCMPGSLTSGFLWSRWPGKHSQHSRRMRIPQFYISDKRPMKRYFGINATKSYCYVPTWVIFMIENHMKFLWPQSSLINPFRASLLLSSKALVVSGVELER